MSLKFKKSLQGVLFKRLLLMSRKIKGRVQEEVKKTTQAVQREAKARAPRDTGALVKSISVKYYNDGLTGLVYTKTSKVGRKSGVGYAHLVEFGSGSFYNPPPGGGRRGGGGAYRPPSRSMLGAWAERKGLPPFPVARAVGLRGGVVGRPFLFPAFESNRAVFIRRLKRAVWEKGVKKVARGAA